MRLLHHSRSNRNDPDAASTSVVSAGFIPEFEQSDMRAGSALCIRCRKFGGVWRVVVSDTAKAKSAKSTSFIYALH